MRVSDLSLIELVFMGDGEDQFGKVLKGYLDAHAGVTFIDLLKFLYQSVLGAHHIFEMMKENEIRRWVEKNLSDAKLTDHPLTEKLYRKRWVRINLGAFKKKYGNNHEKLSEVFLNGRNERRGSMAEFLGLQDRLTLLVKNGKIKPSSIVAELTDLVESFVADYKRKGCPPLHHTKLYMERNTPYLVFSSNVARTIQVHSDTD